MVQVDGSVSRVGLYSRNVVGQVIQVNLDWAPLSPADLTLVTARSHIY